MNANLLGKRIAAMTIDWMIASFTHAGLLLLLLRFGYLHEIIPKIIMLPAKYHSMIYFSLVIMYYMIFEGLFSTTIGKAIFALKVVDDQGNRPMFRAIALRNIFRISDQFLLFGSMFLFVGEKKKRLGDYVAGTNVVSAHP